MQSTWLLSHRAEVYAQHSPLTRADAFYLSLLLHDHTRFCSSNALSTTLCEGIPTGGRRRELETTSGTEGDSEAG